MKVYDITINDLKTPVLDSLPRVSWKTDCIQSEYRVTVKSDKTQKTVYDSGYVKSADSMYIPVDAVLSPLERYTVSVESKDTDNNSSNIENTHFLTGKLDSVWDAKWIRAYFAKDKDEKNQRSSYFRKSFNVTKKVKNATLVICGLGQFYATINGQKVAEDFLPTPYTDFSKQTQYRVYDVTALLRFDANAIAVILGNGFYNSTTNDPWQSRFAVWKDCPKLICELHIEYENGDTSVIKSDETWKSSKGAITFNQMRHGEHVDNRLFEQGWNQFDFDDSHWAHAKYVRAPGGILKVMEMEPITLRHILKPIAKWKSARGWIFDAGRSVAGVVNMAIKGKRHSSVTLRYSDLIYGNGNLNHEELSSFNHDAPFHTDTFIKGSDDTEYFTCIFTYHGFRYVEISSDYEPDIEDIEVYVICNDLSKRSSFSCSDETVNSIQQLALNSSESMFFSLMSSDTAREQTSWTGDTGLSIEQLATNYNSLAFFRNWQQVLRDAQLASGTIPCIVPSAGWGYNGLNGPDWSHPMYEVPLEFYRYFGDMSMISDNFEALTKYCSYLDSMAVSGIINYGLGDWCPPFIGKAISINMESFKCPVEVSDTAFYHSTLKAAQKSAMILRLSDLAYSFEKRAEYVKARFNQEFFDKKTYTVKGNCQTATAMMIYHGLAYEQDIPKLVDKLVQQISDNNNLLDFGILGMKAVSNVLGNYGHAKLMLDMLTFDGFPSMKHWLDLGATTLFECWNGGGSRNHHMFSCVSEFFYKYIAGISPAVDAKGFDIVQFNPPFDLDMTNAKADIDTPYGVCSISWNKSETNYLLNISVPHTIKAVLYLPYFANDRSVAKALDKYCVSYVTDEKMQKHVVNLTKGDHTFTF